MGGRYHISRTCTGTVLESVVSVELILRQYDWYWDNSGLCRISKTVLGRSGLYHISKAATGIVLDYVVSV